MGPQELEDALTTAAARTRDQKFARNAARLAIDWLRSVAASDAGLTSYGSPNVVSARRQLLRSAGLAPLSTPAQLASLAGALGVAPDDTEALVRLAWALRPPAGRLAFADGRARFASMAREASEASRGARPDDGFSSR